MRSPRSTPRARRSTTRTPRPTSPSWRRWTPSSGRLLAPLRDRRFLVYHPAWGEFAATYGLEQVAIERDGKEPGARSLAGLATLAGEARIRVIFVQPQSSPRSAQVLAREIGARVVTVDPLARDYAATLRTLARALVEAAP